MKRKDFGVAWVRHEANRQPPGLLWKSIAIVIGLSVGAVWFGSNPTGAPFDIHLLQAVFLGALSGCALLLFIDHHEIRPYDWVLLFFGVFAVLAAVPVLSFDAATFVRESQPIDGTVLSGGTQFTKTWQVRNAGGTAWDERYHALKISGGYGPDRIQILPRPVDPGSDAVITAAFTTPTASGNQKATYQMEGPRGLFGDIFWVQIEVIDENDEASFVDDGPPADDTHVQPGAMFTKRWTLRNVGTTTWDENYHALRISGTFGPKLIHLSDPVDPEMDVDLTGPFTAPTSAGSYRAAYRMEGPHGIFGAEFWVEVVVDTVVDGETFVEDGPPADGTRFQPGESFTKAWTITNSGTSTWDASYHAIRTEGEYGPAVIALSGIVLPGDRVDLEGQFNAPSSPGTFKATYRIDGPNGLFGDPFWVEIVVP